MSHQCHGPRCEAVCRRTGERCLHGQHRLVDGHLVCKQHAEHGFVAVEPDVVGDEQRARALRILSDC